MIANKCSARGRFRADADILQVHERDSYKKEAIYE